jgi:hypothetical protein
MLRRLGSALALALLCTTPVYALSTTYSAVPEPETAQLFGLGTVALAMARRLRRASRRAG